MDAAALLCNICPKRPTFSDVSHLLTHISSKAHLSHYFKLQVRSHQEQQAVTLLREYDRWYKANNLAKLLSDRMSSKDARRKKTHEKINTDRGVEHQTTGPLSTAYLSPQNPLPDYLDPRLSRSYVVTDSEPGSTTSPHTSSHAALPGSSYYLSDSYPGLEHPLTSASTPKQPTQRISSIWKHESRQDREDQDTSAQATLYWSKPLGSETDAVPVSSNESNCDPFIDDNDNDSVDFPANSEIDKERADEIARLKGVLWPGMDIFDSATEQMRRRRNQKKDESILKMMEKTSLCVEPTELVFSPTGVLRKQRVISGNVEDSSPLKGETPIPKRRANRPKRILSQVDSNIHRGQDRKRNRRTTKRSESIVNEDIDGSNIPLLRAPLAPQRPPRYGSRGDDMDEFAMTFKDNKLKPHTGFTVFRDMPNQYNADSIDHHRGDGSHSAASASPHPIFLLRDFTANADAYQLSPGNHDSSLTERTLGMTMDKENIEPLLDVRGRIDPLVDWYCPSLTGHLTSDIGYPPQYFFGDARPVGFSPFDNQESPTRYSFNPLTVSLPRAPADDNPVYTARVDNKSKPQCGTQPGSPEATISEVDEGEFERLYLDGSSC
ncbi:hypothetical protein ASPCADRAFT_52302 [Aspergillus carbonarius ITEM 5010]|uniref:Uncharacterized protein n=1 Tax=Aspergillus carbonarius (strain ITEM 5010) TaxID=602072 RepID=A0A1R3RGY6_ASPC5|nr:hypothetical protein ASPCADRAFT_398127 [Aspergillus carbonarius ITEM 5010]OOF93818.1 hypothetical protein ASPCADRAFT_52302 [Aspergillus carbonarius ITEM 5010]